MDNFNTLKNLQKNSKKIGLRKAVDNHCRNCIYDDVEGGTWRKQVEKCTVTICDLFPFRPRPYKNRNGVKNENK